MVYVECFLTTCGREKRVEQIARRLKQMQNNDLQISVTLLIDGWSRDYADLVLRRDLVDHYQINLDRGGKENYWKLYSKAFIAFHRRLAARRDDATFMSIIQDDVTLADDAIAKSVAMWNTISRHDESIACINLMRDIRLRTTHWRGIAPQLMNFSGEINIKTSWLDGNGWLAHSSGLPSLVGQSLTQPTGYGSIKGSGVFHLLSDLITNSGRSVYVPFRSLLRHDLALPSQMHPMTRSAEPIYEANFAGIADA